jgi:transcriptional regulator with XRE-family HTH domain
MSIGDRIKDLRWDARINQTELARRAGIAKNTMSQIELGNQEPSIKTLEKIARGLGVPVSDLLKEPAPLAHAPSAGQPSETPRIASIGPTGRGPNVSHEMLSEIGIEATDAELDSLNIYIENRWRNRVEGAPSAIVSLARDEVDHEKIARWANAVEDALHYWIAAGRFQIVVEGEVATPEKIEAVRRHTREKLASSAGSSAG